MLTSMVLGFDSSFFGIVISSIPFSNFALIFAALRVSLNVNDRLNEDCLSSLLMYLAEPFVDEDLVPEIVRTESSTLILTSSLVKPGISATTVTSSTSSMILHLG